MTRKKDPHPKTEIVKAYEPESLQPKLKLVGGSRSDDWNNALANQVISTLYPRSSDKEAIDKLRQSTIAGLIGIAPSDELEGMLAAQLLASHTATMECYRRAALDGQTFEGRQEALSQANKLSRTHTMLLEALNKHRGKGQQKVTVEHVHVHAGGQAIVGNVGPPGGGVANKTQEQPHAKRIAHAPQPEMRSTLEADREALPITRDAERTVPDARRKGNGSTERE